MILVKQLRHRLASRAPDCSAWVRYRNCRHRNRIQRFIDEGTGRRDTLVVWNGEKYVEMRRTLLEHKLFPVCRRCCKVELAPEPVVATADLPKRRAIPLTVVHG